MQLSKLRFLLLQISKVLCSISKILTWSWEFHTKLCELAVFLGEALVSQERAWCIEIYDFIDLTMGQPYGQLVLSYLHSPFSVGSQIRFVVSKFRIFRWFGRVFNFDFGKTRPNPLKILNLEPTNGVWDPTLIHPSVTQESQRFSNGWHVRQERCLQAQTKLLLAS